jgi:hypothetical protein
MSRSRNVSAPPPQDSGITFIMVNARGDGQIVRDVVSQIGQAITLLMPSAPRRTAASPAALPTPKEHQPSLFTPETDSEPVDEVFETTAQQVHEPVRAQKTPAARRPPKAPKIVTTLDPTGGEMPLDEFLKRYSVEETTKNYLLCAYWLKAYRQQPEVRAADIHTCFRHMGWQTPTHARQPLIDMKRKQQWFEAGSKKGTYAINPVGEGEVQKMMNAKE